MKKANLILISLLLVIFDSSCKQEKSNNSDLIIPFNLIKNQIMVEVLIDEDGPYNMIFDTGVTPSTIDIEVAKKLKLAIDTSNAGLATGRGSAKVQLFPTVINNLKLGNLRVDSLDAVTLDHKFLGKALGKPLLGILGHSLLKDRIFKIDYQKKEIHFFNSRENLDKTLKGKDLTKEKFIYQKGDIIPIIENFMINDNPFIASLDTGSSLNIEIFKHHFAKFQIEIDTSKTYQITGTQGKSQNISVLIEEFDLGSKTFHDIEGGVAKMKNTSQLRQGNIGNGFLKQFKVSFDYVNSEVIFEYY